MSSQTILKIFLLTYFVGCTTPKNITNYLEELQIKEVTKVSLQDLLKNKAMYQGHYIETEGVYQSRFEESAIYYQISIPVGDTIHQHLVRWDGLWIDTYHLYKVSTDSIKDKMIRVRGLFDTTTKGHLNQYAATLKDTYLMQGLR